MAEEHAGWTRGDWARWFIEKDDVDEAAGVLQPGDAVEVGRSDSLNLAAALSRRGLRTSYEGRQLRVDGPAAEAGGRPEPMAGELASGARKPPARQTPSGPAAIKKLA